jgi:hypothetical protein
MKKVFFVFLWLPFAWACGSSDTPVNEKPEGDVDAAREFIRAALDGSYKKARNLILPDSANVQLLDNLERAYTNNTDVMEQRGYRESNIRIHDTRKMNESASIVVYSNSFKNKRDSVKVVRQGADWLVDLKYSFPQTTIPQ